MLWILFALLNPAFHAGANILDDILARKQMTNTWALIFYTSLFNLIFLPAVLFIAWPVFPGLKGTIILILLGLTNFLYLFPYYKALQSVDTSIVAALFSLTKIFIPMGAFFLVGEALSSMQYLGCTLIIFASGLLTLDVTKLKFNPAFFYMLFSSGMIVAEGLLFKYAFEQGITWGTALSGQLLFAFLWVIPLMVIATIRKGIMTEWRVFKKTLHLFGLEELLTFCGSMAGTYAIVLAPLTFTKTVESFQPVFVLGYAALLSKFFPRKFDKEKASVTKKGILFGLMFFGALLMMNA